MGVILLAVIGILGYLPFVSDPRVGKEIIFLAVALAVAPFALTRAWWVVGFYLWSLLSLFLHPSLPGLNQVLLMLMAIVLLHFAQNAPWSQVEKVLLGAGVVICLLVLVQKLGWGPSSFVTLNPARPYAGFTGSTADTAAFLAPLCVLAFSKRYALLFGVFLLVLLDMKSAAALAGVGCGCLMLFFAFVKGKEYWDRVFWVSFVGLLVVFTLPFSVNAMLPEITEALTDDRWKVWYLSVKNPLTQGFWLWGKGVATYQSTFGGLADGYSPEGVLQVKWFAEAHNEYVQVFYEFGIVGLILMLGVLVDALLRAWKAKPHVAAALLSGAVVACGHFTLHLVLTAIPLVILLGVALSCAKETETM